MRLFLSAIAVSVTMITSVVYAAEVAAGDLIVEQAWARATTLSAKTGATYLAVRNTGSQPDRILSLETPVAGHAVAHQTRQEGDVSRMSETGPLIIPPGGTLEMKPGGMHIMLMDLSGGLKAGQQFSLTITFERAGKIEVPVKIGKPSAMGPE